MIKNLNVKLVFLLKKKQKKKQTKNAGKHIKTQLIYI